MASRKKKAAKRVRKGGRAPRAKKNVASRKGKPSNDDDAYCERDPDEPPVATVFGAGVAGLSAAHELIERGFVVQVVDPTPSLDHDGCVEVGGMARTQYGHARPFDSEGGEKLAEWTPRLPGFGAVIGAMLAALEDIFKKIPRPVPPVYGFPEHIYYESGDEKYDADITLESLVSNAKEAPKGSVYAIENREKLDDVENRLAALCKEYERWQLVDDLKVNVIGYSDGQAKDPYPLSQKRADGVRGDLEGRLAGKPIQFASFGLGDSDPVGDDANPVGRARNNRVEIHVEEIRLPGEHGYRFFPSFYRHLDDVMKRTPLYDEDGSATRHNALAALLPAEVTAFALEDDESPYPLTRRRFRSFEEMRRVFSALHERLDFPEKDVARYALKVFRYATTSSRRRTLECEDLSWWDFVEGHRYSPEVQRHIDSAPKALIATSTKESDARTNGNVTIQLLLDQLKDGKRTDRILRGPTSESWLRHWKTYLERQNVRFFSGVLHGFSIREIDCGEDDPTAGKLKELVPTAYGTRHGKLYRTGRPRRPVPPIPEPVFETDPIGFPPIKRSWNPHADFYVLALPVKRLQAILRDSISDPGVLAPSLRAVYEYDVGARKPDGTHGGTHRDFFGLQYYFANDFKYARGHTYFVDSDWGLSTISQMQYWWNRRMSNSGYLGVLSVDIGNPHERDASVAKGVTKVAGVRLRQARDGSGPRKRDETMQEAFDATESAYDAIVAVSEWGPTHYDVSIEELEKKIWDGFGVDIEAGIELIRTDPTEAAKDIRTAIDGFSAPPLRDPTSEEERIITRAIEQGIEALDKIALAAEALAKRATVPLPREQRRQVTALEDLLVTAHGGTLVVAAAYTSTSAWRSHFYGMAVNTWSQIKLGLDANLAGEIPDPIYFHLDEGIKLHEDDAVPVENCSLYHIAKTGCFRERPGPIPCKVGPDGRPVLGEVSPDGQSIDFYEVCHGRYTLAGSFTKTYSRLATMEHSNEAARHAVNAILRQIQTGRRFDYPYKYRGANTLHGDYCRIWDPEEHEFDELEVLKRIDAQLSEQGLPHFVEILGLEEAIERWVPQKDGQSPIEHVFSLISMLRDGKDWEFMTRLSKTMGARAQKQFGQALQKLVERAMRLGN